MREVNNMSTVVATARCYEETCDGLMEGRKSEYQYKECGLKSVYLKDILVFHCPKCNAVVPEIPAAGVLHWVIALRLVRKKTLLSGSEMKFLRKLLGKSTSEFAEIMGVSNKSSISRWEKSDPGKDMDRIMRLLVVNQLVGKILGKETRLKSVTPEGLLREIQENLKIIESKKGNKKNRDSERCDISPEELAKFGGSQSDCEHAELAGTVQ